MKHIRRFNEELNKSTYLSAADKLSKLGGVHTNRSKALKIHARNMDNEYDVHNLYCYEFKIYYSQIGINKYKKYDDMMLTDFDFYTIVGADIETGVNGLKYNKLLLINLQSAKTNDKVRIELGITDTSDDMYEYEEDIEAENDDDDEIYDTEDLDLNDAWGYRKYYTKQELDDISNRIIRNLTNESKNVVQDLDVYFAIKHISDDGDIYANTHNRFNFSSRTDALEFKRFILDWYKKDNSDFISDIKNIPINYLYK